MRLGITVEALRAKDRMYARRNPARRCECGARLASGQILCAVCRVLRRKPPRMGVTAGAVRAGSVECNREWIALHSF